MLRFARLQNGNPQVLCAAVLLAGMPVSAANNGGGAVAPSTKSARLKVSSNGRYFVDQDGKPFFYLAGTCWLLFQRPNHEEVDEYLKDRAGKGFTVIQAYLIRGLDKRHPDGNRSLVGQPPFIDRDPTRPNEAFFKNVDDVINRANELGLVLGLVTAKSWHVNNHPEKVFNETNAYENHPTGAGKPRVDAHKVRTQAYAAMLAGAAGHACGALDLFWFFKA
ncbi:MAG TPA: DUF4038 domain-containing protein [Pirellulales bacterium]|nr:DUF4038 domain-containing protein [Pirellulales bacterium]